MFPDSITGSMIRQIQVRKIEGQVRWTSPYYNVIYVLKGSLTTIIDGMPFEDRKLLAWHSDQPVQFYSQSTCQVLFLLLRPEAMIDLWGGRLALDHISPTFSLEQEMDAKEHLLRLLEYQEEQSNRHSLAANGRLMDILQLLIEDHLANVPLPKSLVPLSDKRLASYRSLSYYLASNYNKGITLASTAEVFDLTPQYLGRFLKETRGMTFRQVLDQYREEERAYRKIYVSQEAASDAKSETDEDLLPGTADNFRQSSVNAARPSKSIVSPERAFVTASIEPVHHQRKAWKKLINLGYASALNDNEIASSLDRTQKDVGFQYGRICRITDLIYIYELDGSEVFDYSSVFILLDQLIDHNMIPFLELGNKSFAIQETNRITVKQDPTDSDRVYFDQLLRLLPGLIQACINRYGKDVFDHWYFEISYIYTDTHETDNYTFSQYLKAFQAVRNIIGEYSSRCRVGGPGFNNWWSDTDLEDELKLMISNDIIPDFLSLYSYPIEDLEDGRFGISGNPDLDYKRLKYFTDISRRYLPDTEIWVTEFNSSLSSRNMLNDFCYQAAYISRFLQHCGDLNITAAGYYVLTDAPLRYLDTYSFLFGGWGLFTDTDVPKPSYHLYRMMNQLGTYYIKSTKNMVITADSKGSFQFMITRYCHPKDEFRDRNVEKEDLLTPGKVFENSGRNSYHIELKNVIPGLYIVREYVINAEKSSLYKSWKDLSFLTLQRTPEAAGYYRESEMPPAISTCIVDEHGIFTMDTDLTDIEVRLVTCSLYSTNENIIETATELTHRKEGR